MIASSYPAFVTSTLAENTVEVLAGGLGGARELRVPERLDAGDLGSDAVADALVAEIGAQGQTAMTASTGACSGYRPISP